MIQSLDLAADRLTHLPRPGQIGPQRLRDALPDPLRPLDTAEQGPGAAGMVALGPLVREQGHHEHLQGQEVRHEQLGGGVGGVNEDGELIVAHVPDGGVEAAEVGVAGLGGGPQREEDREQRRVELLVHAGVEERAERLDGEQGRGEQGGAEGGQVLEPRQHDAQVDVLLDVEGGAGILLVDLLRHQGAAAHHGDEVRHAVAHVRGLEGERVAGGQQGVGFAVASALLGERCVQALDRLPLVDHGRGAVVVLRRDPGQVRRTEREERVHQIVVLEVHQPCYVYQSARGIFVLAGQRWGSPAPRPSRCPVVDAGRRLSGSDGNSAGHPC